jgi:transcriptional regulator with XRE-family HTH domain
MTPNELATALNALGWKQSDFCRKAGLNKNTPTNWLKGKTPIPAWVPAYLGAMLDIQRLHLAYVATASIQNAETHTDSDVDASTAND